MKIWNLSFYKGFVLKMWNLFLESNYTLHSSESCVNIKVSKLSTSNLAKSWTQTVGQGLVYQDTLSTALIQVSEVVSQNQNEEWITSYNTLKMANILLRMGYIFRNISSCVSFELETESSFPSLQFSNDCKCT